MLDIRRSFGVFFSARGRVAESGLRHSTRNRAWGNPPWVRIPPLPPTPVFHDRIDVERPTMTFSMLPDAPRVPVASPAARWRSIHEAHARSSAQPPQERSRLE